MGNVVKTLGFIFVMVLSLGGCSHYSSNGEDLYLKGKQGARLQVPAPLTNDNVGHLYDLPDQDQKAQVSIAPPVENITL